MKDEEKTAYEYVTSMWDNYHAMTYGRFDICDPEGTMDYIKAAEFTRERIEHIRQVDIDIKWLHIDEERDYENIKSCADGRERHAAQWLPQFATHNIVCRARIMAFLQERLSELKRGMR